MKLFLKKAFSRPVRKYIYILALAVAPLLVFFGLLDPKVLPFLVPALLALLNLTPADVEQAQIAKAEIEAEG